MSVAAIIAGIGGPALIALLVYFYRSIVTYDLLSLRQSIRIEDNKIVTGGGWPSKVIRLERLTLQNKGLKNLKDVKLHLEHTPALSESSVTSTKTIGKGSIQLATEGDDLVISIAELPRAEKIVLELCYFGEGWGPYRDLKGSGASYRVVDRYLFDASRKGLLWGVIFGGLFVASQIANLLVQSK